MNACQTRAMVMPVVMTPKGLLFVNAKLGILEMVSIVPVSISFIDICKIFYNWHLLLISFISLDIDECLSNPCHVNANCSDTQGSFGCQCNTGYSGNGFNCSSKYAFRCYMKNVLPVIYLLLFVIKFCRH